MKRPRGDGGRLLRRAANALDGIISATSGWTRHHRSGRECNRDNCRHLHYIKTVEPGGPGGFLRDFNEAIAAHVAIERAVQRDRAARGR